MITEFTTARSGSGTLATASPQIPAPRTAGIQDDLGQVLAQVPDLDPKATPSPLAAAITLDGRIISQALSMKMVFGLGIGLIIGALLPFMFGKGSAPKPVQELRNWDERNGNSTATEQTLAPKWQPAPPASVAAREGPTVGISPPPPGDYRPASMGPPSWSRPQTSAAPPAAPPPANRYGADYAGPNPPPARGDGRGYVPTADRRNDAAAPYRNLPNYDYDRAAPGIQGRPATPYRNSPTYDYRGNPVEAAPARRDGPSYSPPIDDRYGNPPAPPAAGQGGQQLPPNGYGAGGNYGYQQDSDPGVARFDGTITAPPARTNQ